MIINSTPSTLIVPSIKCSSRSRLSSAYGIVDIYRKDVAGNSLGGNGDQGADISASISPAHISCLGEYAVNSWGGGFLLLSEAGETNIITSLVVFLRFR
jgi:hypothetical protein